LLTWENAQAHTELGKILPTWTDGERRAEYLFRSSAAWQALGVIGYLLSEVDDEDERTAMLTAISEEKLSWLRSNLGSQSSARSSRRSSTEKCVSGSHLASRQAIDGSIGFLKKLTGLASADRGDVNWAETIMTDLQITCINKQPRQNPYEGITRLGEWAWRWTRQQVIDAIVRKEYSFHTVVNGQRADVGMSPTGHICERMQDGVWNDNLLALSECAA
jgi:hypothetical protein